MVVGLHKATAGDRGVAAAELLGGDLDDKHVRAGLAGSDGRVDACRAKTDYEHVALLVPLGGDDALGAVLVGKGGARCQRGARGKPCARAAGTLQEAAAIHLFHGVLLVV